jgi:thymidylate kinase
VALQPFICIEGLDGVGKTTIARTLAERIGGVYYKTPPPPYDSIRQTIDLRADPRTRFCFYLSAVGYASHQIGQLLMTQPVVCDRYIYSTIAYHSAMDATLRSMVQAEHYLQADCPILLAADENERMRRVCARPRNSHDGHLETDSVFLMNVYREFRRFNLELVDTTGLDIEAVVEGVLVRVMAKLRGKSA